MINQATFFVKLIVLIGIASVFANCNNDVSSLTYREMRAIVFKDTEGQFIEWHGEALDMMAADSLSFQQNTPCGEGGCGKSITITNTSNQLIEAIINTTFDIPGQPGRTALQTKISPGASLMLGCSHLCYQEKSYLFDYKIVGAKFVNE